MKFKPALSYLDAFFFSLMIGAGETYFVAFAYENKISPVLAGLLLPIAMILGALMSIFFVKKLESLKSVKRVVVGGVVLQALSFLPLCFFSADIGILYFGVTAYYFFGFLAGPAWNLWVSLLVSRKVASHFFSRRMRFSQTGLLIGLIVSGFFLQHKWGGFSRAQVFIVLFVVSTLARLISAWTLARLPAIESPVSLTLSEALGRVLGQKNYRSFFGFLFIFYTAIAISSPFVNPFFLSDLKLNYDLYMEVLAALFIGKFLVLPWGAGWIEKFGVRKVMLIGALGISPLPILWVWIRDFEGAFLLQMISGCFWALFEMGFTILFFHHLKHEEKIPLLSLYNLFNALAMAIGGAIGGLVLQYGAASTQAYEQIFVFGSILRVIIVGGVWGLGYYLHWPENGEEPQPVGIEC